MGSKNRTVQFNRVVMSKCGGAALGVARAYHIILDSGRERGGGALPRDGIRVRTQGEKGTGMVTR